MSGKNIRQEQKNAWAVLISGSLILVVGSIFIFQNFYHRDKSSTARTEEIAPIEKDTSSAIPTITADTIRQKILNGQSVVFLDTRNKASFDDEHIPHALLVSPGTLDSFTPKQDDIVVIVYSIRDTQTREAIENILRQKSYSAFILQGGFEEWKKGGNQVLSYGDQKSFLDQSKVTYISPQELAKVLGDKNTLLIIDVQSEQNFQRKHIKGALNIPLEQLEKRSYEIPKARSIVIYGESGTTSFQGGVRLADLNFFLVQTLSGDDTLKPGSGLPLEP